MIIPSNYFNTVGDILRYAVTVFQTEKLFFGHGISNAFDEAAYLILYTLKLPLEHLKLFLNSNLLPKEMNKIHQVIKKRVKDRIPAAYITNEAWLGDYSFFVDRRVVIPRSFLAELIQQKFTPWLPKHLKIKRALDLCTGSGCLSILLADAFQNASIDAVDISDEALEVAKYNVKAYALNTRINLIKSNLYTTLPAHRYDLIISNPPYVNNNSMKKLPKEHKKEPKIGLSGGKDGMDWVRLIIQDANKWLTSHGILIVEIGNERSHLEIAFPQLKFVWLHTSTCNDAVFLLHAKQLHTVFKT